MTTEVAKLDYAIVTMTEQEARARLSQLMSA